MHYASVTMRSPAVAVLHSQAPFPSWPPSPTTFCKTLEYLGNPSLWVNLHMDGEGEWAQQSLLRGSLCIAHDDSYMPENLADMCLAAVIMYCWDSKNWVKVTVVQRSNKASNYRGKLLGAYIPLLILQATTGNMQGPYPLSTLFCNNRGVISHGNSPQVTLPEKQVQADLILLIKHLASTNNC
jgi:hypothetical protein